MAHDGDPEYATKVQEARGSIDAELKKVEHLNGEIQDINKQIPDRKPMASDAPPTASGKGKGVARVGAWTDPRDNKTYHAGDSITLPSGQSVTIKSIDSKGIHY